MAAFDRPVPVLRWLRVGRPQAFLSTVGVWFLPLILLGAGHVWESFSVTSTVGLGVHVRRGGGVHHWWPWSSNRLPTSRLKSAGARPARRCRVIMLAGFNQPVIERQVLFNAGSSFLAWDDLSQTGHVYSAEEK